MRKLLLALALCASPAMAEPTKGYYTMDAMGCMLLRECTDGVQRVNSMLDVSSNYDNMEDFTDYSAEFNNMLDALNQIGVKVFIADERYFPPGHRGACRWMPVPPGGCGRTAWSWAPA